MPDIRDILPPLPWEIPSARLTKKPDAANTNIVVQLLIAMAGSEALEHNAMVSTRLLAAGKKLRTWLTDEEWDELVFEELDWFAYPILEPLAGLAVSGALSQIEKQGIDTTKARRLFTSGLDALDNKELAVARQRFIDLKMELSSIGEKL